MKSSLEIAAEAKLKPIARIASDLGIAERYLEAHGHYKAKIHLDALKDLQNRPKGKYILVSAVTPTPFGEGKTVTSIGLGMALHQLGKRSTVTLRQSSLGPTFGIKGGGAGGGYSQVVPLEESILHLTGDIHAVSQAHNQIAAQLDNSLYHGNALNMDPDQIVFRRVVDVNDRFLRAITVGQGRKEDGIPRTTGFDISVASELMAILALVDGEDEKAVIRNLRERIGRMVLAYTKDGSPVTADDIKAAGAATVLMREALKPNLMQTIVGTPVFIHAGPFANIAHGNCSIVSDRLALACSDVVVTEAGFAMDIGGEKFFDIKCRESGLRPDAMVLVTTIRALKMHSGKFKVKSGKAIPDGMLKECPADVLAGAVNLRKHIENARLFGIPVVVAVNSHPEDFDSEIDVVRTVAESAGAHAVAVSRVFADGGRGGLDLAQKVIEASDQPKQFRFLYPLDRTIKEKIEIIATKIYGAKSVEYSPDAEKQIKRFEARGFGKFPICMAKTPLSLSHDPTLKGAPTGYVFPIREVRASVGAGFIYPLAGEMMTMPGLSADPAGAHIDIDENGKTVGLF